MLLFAAAVPAAAAPEYMYSRDPIKKYFG